MCQFVGSCWGDNILVENDINFNWHNILIVKCWLDLVDSMLASQWMNFIHLCVMSFGGVGIGIMTIFQPYYNQCNIGMCCVIEERHGILELWLLFNYIKTNGTLTHVTWAFVVHHQTKLFDVCHVYGLKILKLLFYWKCQHMILCHMDIYVTHLHDTWHLVVCRSSNICEIKPK
jgi:hypothetical protein